MRKIFLIFAILGAVLAGWVPAMAGTLHAARMPAAQAVHMHDHGSGEHGKTKPAAHPVACAACFAIEAGTLLPTNRRLDISARISSAEPRLAGRALSPLDPPPRA
ncbi:hypothetical protein [Shinella sedimenti]|uniref:DUF2946 domain-containing protein n=1 Tax=Shinella sedimenti TaxID=2919913 RepID=A0ABT0CSK4_9HYPH|nr:hypothetical protein [Shinella sedimenti]MCJ8151583.1 hypothetical protein [Shinella sedimenti]